MNKSIAQDFDPDLTGAPAAKQFYDFGNYKDALEEYLKLLKDKPDNKEYIYRIGICYLLTNQDKKYAISYLKQTVGFKEHMPDVMFELGQAYMYSDSLDEAIDCFSKYKAIAEDGTKQVEAVRQIEMCNSAKKFMEAPIDVRFENLGKGVNSDEPDYNPLVPEHGKFLLFTTKSKKATGGNMDFDGYKPADIFYSQVRNGEFSKAKSLGTSINSEWVEELCGLSANGKYVTVAIDNFEGYDDIWTSEVEEKNNRYRWEKSQAIGYPINSEEAETTGCLTDDGQTIYFTRTPVNFPGFGGTDIYVARRLPNNEWTEPMNLGPTINTQYDEEFPRISADEQTLYFASKGHNSMGGYDVFRSEWDNKLKRWSRPKNIGYPLNTTQDNFTFSIDETGRNGYVSRFLPGGEGDLDIYRVVFNNVEEKLTAVVGHISLKMAPEIPMFKYYIYEKEGDQKEFTDDYIPTEEMGWKYVSTEEKEIPEGYAFLVTIIAKVNGEYQKYTGGAAIPTDDPTFEWEATRWKKVPFKSDTKVNRDASEIPLEKKEDLEVGVTVTNIETDEEIGAYVPNKNTGNYVLGLLPGEYLMVIEAEGFKPYSKKFRVNGLSDFQTVVTRDVILIDENLEEDY